MNLTAKEANQLNESKAIIKVAWLKACAVEGAEPTSVFVVFSTTNPAAIEHNNLMLAHAKLVNRIKRNISRRERAEILKSRPYSQAMRRQS